MLSKRNGSQTWMTLSELADKTGVSYAALRQAAWEGRLVGARKSGSVWLATPEIVDRAIERGRIRRSR